MENKTDTDIEDIDLSEFNFDNLPEFEAEQDGASVFDDLSVVDEQEKDDVDTSSVVDEQLFSDVMPDESVVNDDRKEPFFEKASVSDEITDFQEGVSDEYVVENVSAFSEETADNALNEDDVFENEADIKEFSEEVSFDDNSDNMGLSDKDNYGLVDDITEDVADDVLAKNDEFSLMRNETVEREGFAFADIEENETAEEEMFVDEIVSGDAVDEVTDKSEDDFVVADEIAHDDYFAEEEKYSNAEEERFGNNDVGYNYLDDYSPLATIKKTGNYGFLHWYSGGAEDAFFEFGKDSESGSFDANEECKAIHVNVGYDTYGWEVQFSDGVVMNLRDVREYQIRNGRLPSSDGSTMSLTSTSTPPAISLSAAPTATPA